MSSLVAAKCVSSAMRSRPSACSRSRTRYSTAFTSCLVRRLELGEPVDLGLAEVRRRARAGRASASSVER